tara:strand:+ start:754 stop:1128 length:375 start_codon:yes stop_codon:yes gene_type:complete
MDIIIKKNAFDTNKIRFKYGKKCIKIIYDLNYILMIGLTFRIVPSKVIENDKILFIYLQNSPELTILQKIDEFFNKKFNDYISFLHNNIIKVKKHNYKNDEDVYITINNLKKINDQLKVQIFSL